MCGGFHNQKSNGGEKEEKEGKEEKEKKKMTYCNTRLAAARL